MGPRKGSEGRTATMATESSAKRMGQTVDAMDGGTYFLCSHGLDTYAGCTATTGMAMAISAQRTSRARSPKTAISITTTSLTVSTQEEVENDGSTVKAEKALAYLSAVRLAAHTNEAVSLKMAISVCFVTLRETSPARISSAPCMGPIRKADGSCFVQPRRTSLSRAAETLIL